MAKLLLPGGLHAEVFQQVVWPEADDEEALAKLREEPVSHHMRQPLDKVGWFSVRPTVGAPAGVIVDAVVPVGTPGAVCLRQDAAGVLACDDQSYEVELLDLYRNCDLLVRGSALLAKCIAAFGIQPARLNPAGAPTNDNLRPTRELLQIWNGQKTAVWPTAARLQALGFDSAMIDVFRQREAANKAHAGANGPTFAIDLPVFAELMRELLHHQQTTSQILRMAAPQRSGTSLSNADLVTNVKLELAMTVFTNGARWCARCSQSTKNKNNWGGFAIRWAKGIIKRIIRKDRGHRIRPPETPWLKAGPKLLALLSAPADLCLEDAIAQAFATGRLPGQGKGDPLFKAYRLYVHRKKEYLVAQLWKIRQALATLLDDRPNAEQLARALMGFLRACDRKVVNRVLDFDRILHQEIQGYLGKAAWEPTDPGDRVILRDVLAQVDLQSGGAVRNRRNEPRRHRRRAQNQIDPAGGEDDDEGAPIDPAGGEDDEDEL